MYRRLLGAVLLGLLFFPKERMKFLEEIGCTAVHTGTLTFREDLSVISILYYACVYVLCVDSSGFSIVTPTAVAHHPVFHTGDG